MFGSYGASAQIVKTTLRAFMQSQLGAEIRCAYRGTVVRKLVVNADANIVDIDFGDGEVCGLDLDLELRYEPWVMDRGSITFLIPSHIFQPGTAPSGRGKLCTEFDVVCFDDGTEAAVCVDNGRLVVEAVRGTRER